MDADAPHPLGPDWDVIGCPECHVPAEVLERFHLAGTTGWVEHVKIRCAVRHGFLMPVDRLVNGSRTVGAAAGVARAA